MKFSRINSKSDILKETLGLIEYFEMKNFFEGIYNKVTEESSIVIFTTRRCQLLFFLFLNEIEHNGTDISNLENIKLISDKAIHFYISEMSNKKVYIVDDILIHGRTLLGVIRRVKNNNNTIKTINVEVFAENKECSFSDELNEESKNDNINLNFNNYKEISDEFWRILSNKIVSSLILTSTPYVAYSYSYIKEDVSINDFNLYVEKLKRINQITYKENLELSLNEAKIDKEITNIIENNIFAFLFKVEDENSKFSCLRVYYNKLTKEMIVLPFSFLYAYNKKSIENLCSIYFDKNCKINTVKKHHPKYRALTSLYSLKFFNDFNDEYKIFDLENFYVNNNQIDYSYYDGFYEELLVAFKKDVSLGVFSKEKTDLNISMENIIDYSNSNKKDIYVREFCNAIKNTNKNKPIDFVQLIKNIDSAEEKNLQTDGLKLIERERQKGLPLLFPSAFISNEQDFISENEFFKDVIEASDTGLISVYPEEYMDGIFCNYCITGEQACRLYQDVYTIFLKRMIPIFQTENKEKCNTNDYCEFKKFINGILDEEQIDSKTCDEMNIRLNSFDSLEFLNKVIYENQNNFELDSLYWRRVN